VKVIEGAKGNLLEADAEALVNTVNCVGFMGKGIALQFKQAFPENFKVYERACTREEVWPGAMLVYPTGAMRGPKYIINFPTKRHWKGKSRIEDIEAGLAALVAEIKALDIRSIALPPLGCGNGGLEWADVRPRIERALAEVPHVRVFLFEPIGAPAAESMPVRTERPEMTPARALFVSIMDRYSALSYRLTLLEIQKLAYFLQEAGQPLKLNYEAGHYGPYAANLNKVLERIEGHFTHGYGNCQNPDVELDLLDGALAESQAFLADKKDEQGRLNAVSKLIEGFETPYGMELLSSVHWVATHSQPPAKSAKEAVVQVHAWSHRKAKMFSPEHIDAAWDRLFSLGWLNDRSRASLTQ
jgi:O-acetyl-ADP-ribose deacetylase (regulator of RNase III)